MNQITNLDPPVKQDWRKRKKRLRNLSADLQRKGYFVDCNYCPCMITELNPYFTSTPRTFYDADVSGTNLFNSQGSACSLFYCSPQAITEAEANERLAYYKENGKLAYLKKYVYGELTPEQEAELIQFYKDWNWEI